MIVDDAIETVLADLRKPKVVDLAIYRRFKLASGWEPSEENLKEQIEWFKIQVIKKAIRKARNEANEKVLRMNNIKKGPKK